MVLKHEVAPGILKPGDVTMLSQVLEKTLPAGSTEAEREFRAAILVNLFNDGKTTESELVSAMLGTAGDEVPSIAA